jgi:hypothetical protein
MTPFASAFAKLTITAAPPSSFDLNESVILGASSNGIHPLSEEIKLQIGTFSVTVPAGSFQLNPNGRYVFNGVINGVTLAIQIAPTGNSSFAFKVTAAGVNLSGLTNPIPVVLTIGDDTGSTAATADFQ